MEVGSFYVALAFISCVFVVPAMVSLVAQAAVLGAAGRERRLATLRLIGLSNGDVARMTLVETVRQTAVGLVLGTILSMATAPFWALVSFQGNRIGVSEMFLPWWGYVLAWAAITVLALGASLLGLSRVVVSPLGVSRRVMPKAMGWWRVVAFGVIVVVGVIAMSKFDMRNGASAVIGAGLVMFVLLSAIGIIAPWIIQVAARLAGAFGGGANFVATRRVATESKATWRRVSTIALLSVLLGYVAVMPEIEDDSFGSANLMDDVFTGVVLTFAIGLIIVVSSTLLTQASTVYEQAQLTRALDHMGAPAALHGRVGFKQTFWPLVVTTVPAFFFGVFLGVAMFTSAAEPLAIDPRSAALFAVYAGSVVLVAATTMAVEPLRRALLLRSVRRND